MKHLSTEKHLSADKHRAIRTCIGCGERRGQDELLRVGRESDGQFCIGRTLPGRGAWLCAIADSTDQAVNGPCLDRAIARGGFQRAFKARWNPDQVRSSLAPELAARLELAEP